MKRFACAVALVAAMAYGQSNAREAQVLKKIKEIYQELDAALIKHDAEAALKAYDRTAKVYPLKGKPLNIVDAVLLLTERYSNSKTFKFKTSTKTITVNGNSARVRAVVTMEAQVPDRENPKKLHSLKLRSVTDDYWTYNKGWRITKVRSIEDRTWENGKEVYE
ncbi:MAG: hypothetical protein JNJ45_04890 [Chthonomonas sp.]|nr:hypothetical protein [Chthonomonas sp.]